MRAVYMLAVGSFASVLVACGGSPAASFADAGPTEDAGITDDAAPADDADLATYPAVKPDMPRVVSGGGAVLKKGSVTPVYLPGFDYVEDLTDFTKKLGATQYWAALGEYGVGQLTQSAPIVLTNDLIVPADIGNITDEQIQAWLIARFDGTHPEFGTTPDPTSVYTLFYPEQTVITLGTGGGTSCQSFGGYHNDVTIKGQLVPYAVIPECNQFGALKNVDSVTAVTSHELSEAATDPYPTDDTAYGQVDGDHLAWEFFLGGGEVGDMCAQFSTSIYKPDDLLYVVQNNWSNVQAKAGHNPCQPVAVEGQVYFNASPTFPDKINTRGVFTKGVKVPVGESKTIPLALYSDGPMAPWTVTATTQSRGGTTAPVTLALDKSTGGNGDILNLTITAKTAITSTSKAVTILITSSSGGRKNTWIGLVGN